MAQGRELQTIWGPANIQELGRVLGLLAGRSDFPGPLRVRICEALLPRLNQLTIARSLARVSSPPMAATSASSRARPATSWCS